MSSLRRLATMLALALAASAAAGHAQDLESLYRAGFEAFRTGETHKALELLGTVAAADADYRDVQLLLGQSCLAAGLPSAAKQHFERVLEADPGNGHAAYLLGLALYQAARYFEAARAFERARELAPQNPYPSIYRGLALLRLGHPDEARGEIETALASAPEEPAARNALAELELAAGELDSAEQIARGVIADLPATQERFEATLLLGRIVYQAGRPAEAAAIFRQALTEGPERSDVLYLLSQALLRSGEAEAGQAFLERFRTRKALEEQVRVLEAAIKADPDHPEPRIRLVRLLLEHRQTGSALRHLPVLRRLAPGDPRVRALDEEVERLRRESNVLDTET